MSKAPTLKDTAQSAVDDLWRARQIAFGPYVREVTPLSPSRFLVEFNDSRLFNLEIEKLPEESFYDAVRAMLLRIVPGFGSQSIA
jgi:hypothetical protein